MTAVGGPVFRREYEAPIRETTGTKRGARQGGDEAPEGKKKEVVVGVAAGAVVLGRASQEVWGSEV